MGGAIYTNNASVVITGTYFSDNNVGSGGGHGGAIYISSAWSSGTVLLQ